MAEALYDEVFLWAKSLFENNKSDRLIIGMNAPQGAGKTTLGKALEKRFLKEGIGFLPVSIDDFYLTFDQQNELAAQYSNVPYFQQRGYPGTHDISLGVKTFQSFQMGKDFFVPRYNKSSHQGRGDRRPNKDWSPCGEEIKILFVEGWMLGFMAVDNCPEELNLANQKILEYEAWSKHLDSFLHLRVEDFHWVVDWRVEAEENRKASGEEGLSLEKIRRYAKMFLPAYETFSPTLEKFKKRFKNSKTIEIGKDRMPKNG